MAYKTILLSNGCTFTRNVPQLHLESFAVDYQILQCKLHACSGSEGTKAVEVTSNDTGSHSTKVTPSESARAHTRHTRVRTDGGLVVGRKYTAAKPLDETCLA